MTEQQGKMRIIGAGFGRTGTLSTMVALEKHLGFVPCHHMSKVAPDTKTIEQLRLWENVHRNNNHMPPDVVHELFDSYVATVDFPASLFTKELIEAYPNAKVLLNKRDPEKWYASCRQTIFPLACLDPEHAPWGLVFFLRNVVRWLSPWTYRLIVAVPAGIVFGNAFDGRFADKDKAIQKYNDHISEVRRMVPKERLLEWSVTEGWEPLCKFLEVPVPVDTPFPNVNDSTEMKRTIRVFSVLGYVSCGLMAVAVAVAVWKVVSLVSLQQGGDL